MQEKLLWTGNTKNRPLPKTFSEENIMRIITQPLRCQDYWKIKGYAAWGKFFKFRDSVLLATIYMLGTRPKEACCLKFEDINWHSSRIRIRSSTNKTHKERIIPLPKKLKLIYGQYFKFPRARFWKGSPYLFPSFLSEHISPSTLKTILREKVLKPLGIWNFEDKRTIYKLRHSRASHLLSKQIKKNGYPDIFSIANILGHADIRSTLIYLHTDESYMDYLQKQIDL